MSCNQLMAWSVWLHNTVVNTINHGNTKNITTVHPLKCTLLQNLVAFNYTCIMRYNYAITCHNQSYPNHMNYNSSHLAVLMCVDRKEFIFYMQAVEKGKHVEQ